MTTIFFCYGCMSISAVIVVVINKFWFERKGENGRNG